MSSFFTLPSSQRKRKRNDQAPTSTSAGRPARRPQTSSSATQQRPTKKRREERDDESISGDESDGVDNVPSDLDESDDNDDEADDDDQDQNLAARRTRLAEQYLENTRAAILAEQGEDGVGFDARDVDKELLAQRMGERLKDDSAESKGKMYRFVAQGYEWDAARHASFKIASKAVNCTAVCWPRIYTGCKDGSIAAWEMQESKQDQGQDQTLDGDEHDDDGEERSDAVGNGDGETRQKADLGPLAKPKKVLFTRGNSKFRADTSYQHHTASILCIAASQDGRFVVTGGQDRKLIVWNASDLKPLKVFTHHRDAVTALCFRRGTNQLFSASRDRTVKIWSLDELAYVETLYGHQDEVLDVGALNQEKCVTVGARDRTARYWRVVEETQLVFRGGGAPSSSRKPLLSKDKDSINITPQPKTDYHEGSIDRIAMVDDETFVTGSDNGALSLWSIQKKKAMFSIPLAHGVDPPMKPEEASAETYPDSEKVAAPRPRWITALACLPYADLVVSGSWDGVLRVWQVSEDRRRLEAVGVLGGRTTRTPSLLTNGDDVDGDETAHGDALVLANHLVGQLEEGPSDSKLGLVNGIVNDLAIYEKGDRGNEGVGIVAAIGKEHRLGRWVTKDDGRNYSMVFEVQRSGGR